MKKNQIEELRKKNLDQLEVQLEKSQQELVELRFKFSAGQIKDVKSVAKKKKEIAVIKTLISEKKSRLKRNQKEK